jgi:L-lysine exporter family protein LysE/ArgO
LIHHYANKYGGKTLELTFSFLKGFLYSLSLCCGLGIVNLSIIKTGIERGYKSSFLIGFGSCFGDLIYLLSALLGVTIIFEISIVKWIVWIVGTLVLLYFTFKMLKESLQPKLIDTSGIIVAQRTDLKYIVYGLGLALSSPTSIIFFAATAAPIVANLHSHDFVNLASFVIGFFIAGVIYSIGMAMVSSRAGKILGVKFTRILSITSTFIFLYFAIKVFVTGLVTIIK